ncbi:MAG: hypothetical protein CK431_16935 [Mycobacterium sp.]|nr:MAG: hypothetical protein CK431_16935 [Mycobacterium sp.]
MTELSGFSSAQPLAQIGPQSLRLPTSLAEVCECECDCAASRILRGLAQIVGSRITNLIEIDVQAVDTPDRVQVTVIPWDRYGVDKKGAAPPGGWIAVDGSEVVGMGNNEYARRWSCNMPLEWDAETTAPTATLADDGRVVLAFLQPTSANRPFTYAVRDEHGQDVPLVGAPYVSTEGGVALRIAAELHNPGDTGTYTVHVSTQYVGVEADAAPVTVTVPDPKPEPEPEAEPESQEGS